MQQITVLGNIGRDAEFRTVNGKGVMNFTVAVTEKYKDQNGNKIENTTWYSVSRWVNQTTAPAILGYLKKGQKIVVVGKPESKLYKTSNNETAIDCRINATDIFFAGSAKEQQQQQPQQQQNNSSSGGAEDFDIDDNPDDLPF